MSRLAVTISLSEPKICSYILTVEGERFCEPLQTADKYGILGPSTVEEEELSDIDEEDDVVEEHLGLTVN